MSARLRVATALVLATTLATDLVSQRFGKRNRDKAPAPQSDAAESEWEKAVRQACTARRYGLRLAAARKVAKGGDAAVTAIRAWAKKNGLNAVPAALVNAIADADPATGGDAVRKLLEEWADTEPFYWRAQALRGIAERARIADHERFVTALTDPSHLYRLSGAKGLLKLDQDGDRARVHEQLQDPDPRQRVKIATALLGAGDATGVPILLQAILDNRTFLGDPWGNRSATEASRALDAWLGLKTRLDPNDPAARRTAIAAYAARATEAKGVSVDAGELSAPTPPRVTGGVEIRSCRFGDFFLSWDANGQLFVGLEQRPGPDLSGPKWPGLRQFLKQERAIATYGVVVCDYARVQDTTATTHVKAAPEALPADLARGLKQIAAVLEETGSIELAKALRLRIGQFDGGEPRTP